MNAKAPIFFDLDGVLLDVAARHFMVHSDTLAALDGQVPHRAAYWRMKRNGTPLGSLLAATGNAHVPEADYRRQFVKRIEALNYLRLDTPINRARECVGEFARTRPVFLVTLRQLPDHLELQLRWLGLKDLFTAVYSGHGVEGKLDWEVKRDLIKRSGAARRGSIMVGDTEVDMWAGRAIGLVTVGVLSGIRNRKQLEIAQPNSIINSLADLQRIDFNGLTLRSKIERT